MENPFNITKAFNFNDEQINDYWVDLGDNGFHKIISPSSSMPLLILGGKGSGKTHIMRYHSYYLQKMRCTGNLLNHLSNDGYIGIYFTLSGLEASRFFNKDNIESNSKEKLLALFIYYMELWIAQKAIEIISDMAKSSPDAFKEKEICNSICDLFDENLNNAESFDDLFGQLSNFKKQVDIALNNYSFTASLNVKINISRGKLIFGIPQILVDKVKELKKCRVVYLMDELENLYPIHQKYIQTLLREQQHPVTFRVGARKYGVKTYSTFCGDEENKAGAEFTPIYLDNLLRGNDGYKKFAKNLIIKRLKKAGFFLKTDVTLGDYFEQYSESVEEWMLKVISNSKELERKYFKKLRNKLEKAKKLFQEFSDNDIHTIINALRIESNPLLEKVNIHLFYRAWSTLGNKGSLVDEATKISKRCKSYLHNSENDKNYKELILHFKQDFIAQFCREYRQPERGYFDLEKYIHMSQGLPRNLLMIFQKIYDWAIQNGEKPFMEGKISINSQSNGLANAADWFWTDARIHDGKDADRMESIQRLAELFREIRYSDKPVECSLCTFSFNINECTREVFEIIDGSEKVSLLIEVPKGRPDKNSMRVDSRYQLNSMLATTWKLPIYRRADIRLSKSELMAIFKPTSGHDYLECKKKRLSKMTAPFSNKESKPTLFCD